MPLPPDVEVVAPARSVVDLGDTVAIANMIAREPWSAVINAAAYTQVDRAESEESVAFAINCIAAANLAKETAARLIPFPIQISTDYVFDGQKGSPYEESDFKNPLNVYGRSKLAGENAVREANPQHIILRTAWVHSPFGANFVRTILRLMSERDRLTVVDDQHGCPTAAIDIARACIEIARRCTNSSDVKFGTYHFGGGGRGEPGSSLQSSSPSTLEDSVVLHRLYQFEQPIM